MYPNADGYKSKSTASASNGVYKYFFTITNT